MSGDLPEDVVRFLADHIDSIEQFEILVLLRAHRDRTWTPAQIAAEMRTSEGSASKRLAGLVKGGLVVNLQGSEHRYAPMLPARDAVVAAAAAAYQTRRYAVIDAIMTPPDRLRLFSDAFRFGPKKGQ